MSHWRRVEGVLTRRSGTTILLLVPDKGDPVTLEGIGAVVWTLLEQPADEDELGAVLAEHYATPHDTVARDVEAFLEQLRTHGLVVQVP